MFVPFMNLFLNNVIFLVLFVFMPQDIDRTAIIYNP